MTSAAALLLQYRHYKACLDIFNLHPSKDSREFADLIGFVAQVRPSTLQCACNMTPARSSAASEDESCPSNVTGCSMQTLHTERLRWRKLLGLLEAASIWRNPCLSQVAPCYPKRVGGFVEEVTGLLQTHAAVLDPALRQTLVKALILMRNRDQARKTLPEHLRSGHRDALEHRARNADETLGSEPSRPLQCAAGLRRPARLSAFDPC